jgi:SNF2 family DNA or RNA helicase
MEQGTGKTLTALKIVGNWYRRGYVRNLLILAPKSVLPVWEQELSDSFNIPYAWIHDPLRPEYFPNHIGICLMNYEAMKRFKGKSNKLKYYYDMVIADESHRIKNPASIQSKQAYFLARGARIKLALSGTPKGNSDYDFFSQYRFFDDTIFGPNTSKFREKYFNRCGYMGYDLELKPEKKGEFYNLINEHSFRITKDEALDLPSITENIIPVKLNPKTKEYYTKIENENILELNNAQIRADLAITLVAKLQQICSGFIYNEGEVIDFKDNGKIRCLKDLIEDHRKEKIIVFCKYTHEIDLIREALKNYKILIYDGRSEAGDWKKFLSGKYDILVTQIKKGGTGLNLQIASTVIFFSLTYSYIDLNQAKDRVHRNGQNNKVSIYYLLTTGTIERNIYRILQNKKEGAKAILDDYRQSAFVVPCT